MTFLLELHRLIIQHALPEPGWYSRLARSEVMTILLAYHFSGRQCFNQVAGNNVGAPIPPGYPGQRPLSLEESGPVICCGVSGQKPMKKDIL
jgi:hypothetical protein